VLQAATNGVKEKRHGERVADKRRRLQKVAAWKSRCCKRR
jgi:hypothetical protein